MCVCVCVWSKSHSCIRKYKNTQGGFHKPQMPTHAQVCGVVCRGTLTHTSTDVCSHMRTSTKHMCTLISFFFFFSLCVKRYFLPLNFKALCSTDKHTHTSEKSTTMPLNGGDLDLGHQLHNVHLQQRDKKCLPCFHLL